MKTYNIFTDELDSLPQGKADFLLLTQEACEDAEFITRQKGLEDKEETYSFALITLAINKLNPFSAIESVALTNKTELPSHAKDIFAQGMALGRSYELKGSYLILAQSSLSSQKNILKTLDILNDSSLMPNFEKLSLYCDETLVFCAGFLLEASRRFHIVLGGGIEMALTLLIADKVREDVLMRLKSDNLTYATTAWTLQSSHAKDILNQLSYKAHAIYTPLDLKEAEIEKLQKYAQVEKKDGAGAGAALAYGVTNGLTNKDVLDEMELLIYMA